MNTLIINGLESGFKIPGFSKISKNNESECTDIITIELANLKLNSCIGCSSCMFKTPGLCIFKDDVKEILINWLKADLILLFYPVKSGFMNYLTKKLIDRLFPLELPYIEFKKGAFNHPRRYKNSPEIGFVIDIKDMRYWDLNLENNLHIGNFYGKFLFQKNLDEFQKELKNETIYI